MPPIACSDDGQSLLRPGWGGRPSRSTWAERLPVFPVLWLPLLIFLVVIGTIYSGFTTATESAAFGIVVSLVIVAVKGRFRMAMLMGALESTVRVTSMLMLIVVFAFIFNFVINSIGLVQHLVDAVKALQLSKYQTLLAAIIVYIILGCFMETMSMMIATAGQDAGEDQPPQRQERLCNGADRPARPELVWQVCCRP